MSTRDDSTLSAIYRPIMTPTDTQLKQALAKMLPEKYEATKNNLYIRMDIGLDLLDYKVKDTELLHLCWLVEEDLKGGEWNEYSRLLENNIQPFPKVTGLNVSRYIDLALIHATWQQRIIALCKAKGIEVV